jgi:hypothetical protein
VSLDGWLLMTESECHEPNGQHRRNQVAEDSHKLDVNRLNREGCLQAGWSGKWRWHRDDV